MSEPWRKRVELAEGRAVLYLGDCLDVLPHVGRVDAVVTDPPYGIGRAGWDDAPERVDLPRWIESWMAIAPWALWTFRADWLPRLGGITVDVADIWRILVWHKPFTLEGARANWKWHWEPIIYCGRSGTKPDWRPYYRPDVITVNPVATRQHRESVGHNSQKPVDLFVQLLEKTTAETIADPFMGSGTTGVACMNLGRRFIGIEIDERYFNVACERIDQASRQGRLFG